MIQIPHKISSLYSQHNCTNNTVGYVKMNNCYVRSRLNKSNRRIVMFEPVTKRFMIATTHELAAA